MKLSMQNKIQAEGAVTTIGDLAPGDWFHIVGNEVMLFHLVATEPRPSGRKLRLAEAERHILNRSEVDVIHVDASKAADPATMAEVRDFFEHQHPEALHSVVESGEAHRRRAQAIVSEQLAARAA